jgi:hypothetical protein
VNVDPMRRLVGSLARALTEGRLKVAGLVCVLVALGAWSVASPVGASPDEDYHLVSIWCSHGERPGLCESPTATSAVVPAALLSSSCYAFHPEQSAACSRQVPGQPMVTTTKGNFDRTYPPVFYWVDGFLAGRNLSTSVVTMRIANLLLFLALFTTVYLLLPAGLRRAQLIATLVTVVPLGMFLVSSINPSGWAILSAATFLVSLLGYVTTDDRRRRLALGATAGVALLLGAGARGDAAMYAVVAVMAVAILTVRSARVPWRRLAYPAVLAVAAGVAFLSVGQASAVDPSSANDHVAIGRFLRIAFDVPALWIGTMGSPAPFNNSLPAWAWGLGWLDTPMPAAVWVGAGGVFAAVLFSAVAGAGRRATWAAGLVGLVAFLVPTYVQALSDSPVGGWVQPRYVLPLLILLITVATVRLDGNAFRLTRGQRWIVVAALAIANGAALYANIRRYVTGTGGRDWNLDRDGQWWWNTHIPPMAICVIGSIAFALALTLVTTDLTDDPTTAPPGAGPGRADVAAIPVQTEGVHDRGSELGEPELTGTLSP